MQRGFRVSLSRHVPASLPMLLSFLPTFLSLNASGVEYRCLLSREGKKQYLEGWPGQVSSATLARQLQQRCFAQPLLKI